MKHKVYTQTRYDNKKALNASIGKSIIIDSATTFYILLESTCTDDISVNAKYDILRNVYTRVVDQAIMDCKIALVGLFSKVDYCIKEYQIPDNAARIIHDTRKELFPSSRLAASTTNDDLAHSYAHNLKATTLLVHYLCGKEPIPESLKGYLPTKDRKTTWGEFDQKVLRVSVERWDDVFIWATEETNGTMLQIRYDAENKYLNRNGESDWAYLKDILWKGATLNLVRLRMDEKGELCLPELIILEPDYLINITTIAACFETYAESPFVNLINKIKPSPNSYHIHLGNLAGQLLDNSVHGKAEDFDTSFKKFVNNNSLSLISCPEFISKVAQFKEDGKTQKRNIEQLINHDLPASIGSYDNKAVILEPSFFSPTLGIQGRFDFLERVNDRVIIIEQKSGKGEFIPFSAANYDPQTPEAKEQHKVQALLYRAIYQYELGTHSATDITPMLLYSKYAHGLLEIPPMPNLFLRAMKMRNLLTWSEYLYANEGMDILASITPENINKKGVSGKLWEEYTKPELQALLSPIHRATKLERAYFMRFMRFIEKELLLSKLGNKTKESSGFASIWHERLEDKKAAGNIYDHLVIDDFEGDKDGVTSVRLRFQEKMSADTSNFRIGDIVILYPYKEGDVPDACADMVNRASIVDINENSILLRLRNPQTDKGAFTNKPQDTLWAVEHDMFESMTSSLYSGMYSFLSAPKQRRDLILSQRLPERDLSRALKGDYGSFNTLSLRAKQASEIFLIIGPPGTGKTSYGLVNLLKEELLEEDANILLVSYTNRAVDEICSKLVAMMQEDESFDFIRIGSDLSCSPAYREHLLSRRSAEASSGSEVSKMIRRCRVFCGTTAAMSANLSLLTLKHFSLAIVDESSQILEPHLIGLLSASKDGCASIDKFVLIGDHKQLPAVVQQMPEESMVTDPHLQDINLMDCRLSLFERLLAQFKTEKGYDERFVYMLTKQGRMHRDIAEFPNYAFYGNMLDIVPLDHQLLPTIPAGSSNGIVRMLTSRRMVFVATQEPTISPSPKTNSTEAEMIAATVVEVYHLTQDTFSADETIGVIVPYRNQISMVRNAIDRYGIDILHGITIDTVERYQGSQRDYIIYGFTIQQPYQLNFLTNNVFEEDGMIIDRKLNVAMTRARLSLVMIGNPTLLCENYTFYKLMEYVCSKRGYLSVSAHDYCRGNFNMPDVADASIHACHDKESCISIAAEKALDKHVTSHIKSDTRTIYPDVILGNSKDANMTLINYGRCGFNVPLPVFSPSANAFVTISPQDQVRLFCHYMMRERYCTLKKTYDSCQQWLSSLADAYGRRIHLIDVGCGPATSALVLYEMLGDSTKLSYLGIEPSLQMRKMAEVLVSEACGSSMETAFMPSLDDVPDNYWASHSEVPSLVIFNLSYYFAKTSSNIVESLATDIITIMRRHPLNKYIFMVQQSDYDCFLRSFVAFRKRMSTLVSQVESSSAYATITTDDGTQTIPYNYEVWQSK